MRANLIVWLTTAIRDSLVAAVCSGVEPKPSRKRVLHEVNTIIVDGACTSLLAVP